MLDYIKLPAYPSYLDSEPVAFDVASVTETSAMEAQTEVAPTALSGDRLARVEPAGMTWLDSAGASCTMEAA